MASQPVGSQPMYSQPMYSIPAPPQSGVSKGLIFGGLALVVALGAGWFFLTPKTGSLVVTVSGPSGKAVSDLTVKVNDEVKCNASPCVVADLPGGKSHVITVTAPGYADTAGKAVKVVAGEETPLNIDLAAASAGTGVKVSSKSPGLRLSVDGKDVGPLPQELTDLKPGSHTIEVGGNPFFATFTKKVEVPADQIVEVEPSLEFIKGAATFELGDNADGAKIWLKGDGEDKALHKLKLPQRITIPANKTMTIVAERKGFAPYQQTISLSAEEPEKTYRISLSKEGEEPKSTPTPRTGGGTAPTPSPGPAETPAAAGGTKLNINSIPMSNVILDGKPLGSTPKIGVSVSPGAHTVVFVHPQHGRKVQQVNVAAGKTGTATVRFP